MSDPTNTTCQRFEARMAELIGGDASSVGFVELCVHVRGCDDCGEMLEIHTRLQDLSAPRVGALDEPSETEWARVRETVLAELRSDPPAAPESSSEAAPLGDRAETQPAVFGAAGPKFGRPLEWLAAAALAGVLLGSGWWLGRSTGEATSTSRAATNVASDQTFAVDESLDGYEIDNVRVRDVDGETVSVSFDMATHVETLRPRTDPLVREAVVRSLWGGADLGGRIAAIEQSGELPLSATVRDALLHAMLKDPDVAVRMSAQQRLANAELDDRVEAALLQVLRSEQSVQMRLLAVDMLAARRVDPAELVRAVEEGQPEPGNALKLLAANYARKF